MSMLLGVLLIPQEQQSVGGGTVIIFNGLEFNQEELSQSFESQRKSILGTSGLTQSEHLWTTAGARSQAPEPAEE